MPKGSCLCGAFSYEVPESANATVVCHCIPCMKLAGANGSTNGSVPKKDFKHTGQVRTYVRKGESGKSVTNSYCAECCALMFVEAEAMPEVIIFKPGTLDDKAFLNSHPPVQEIFMRNTPSSFEPLKGAEQKDGQ